MFADRLKKSLLQAAIQGQLTEQLPTDGDARDLLRKIRAEKTKLIATKKIKAEKPLPPITADEVLFDIHDNWCWCRLNDLYNFIDYRGKTPTKISTGIPLITAKNVKFGYNDYSIREYISEDEFLNRQSRGVPRKGDILFTTEAPLGNASLADLKIFSAGQRVITFQAYDEKSINNQLMMFFFLSESFQKMLIENKTGTTVTGIKAEKLKKLIIPLPPIAEQERIVEKLNELLSEVDELAKDEHELVELEETFPRRMRNSLLQAAIQGKLTEQLPSDGDARDLLRKIRTEKAKLLAEKKIKTEKPLPPISDDEIPFDLPDNWCWCRLGEVCEMYTGNSIAESEKKAKYLGLTDGFSYIGTKDISFDSRIDYDNGIRIPFENNLRRAKKNSVLMCIEGGSAGRKIAVTNQDVCFGNKLCNFNSEEISNRYIYFYLQSSSFKKFFVDNVTGIIGGVSLKRLNLIPFPLPPLDEQKRIAERLEELLPLC